MFIFYRRFACDCRAHFYVIKNAGGDVNNGEKNLIPFSERTEDEQRKIRQKGGKASGKSRREKRDIKKAMETLLKATVNDDDVKAVVSKMFGMSPGEVTWLDSCVAGTVREAVNGNVKAMHEIRDIMGETSMEESGGVQIVITPRGSEDED